MGQFGLALSPLGPTTYHFLGQPKIHEGIRRGPYIQKEDVNCVCQRRCFPGIPKFEPKDNIAPVPRQDL